ncbi:hypothetical protein KEM55_006450 [Ascosphaera atra]|nr:hypothetical protein KEM55_006450 [Ascosphaera atra]
MRPLIGKPWQQSLQEALDRYLTPEEGQLVKETWKIGQRKDENIPVDLGLLRFINDVRFYWPIARTLEAAAPDANIHVYHFHQENKWDGGPGKGLATHELDLAMLLLNYNELLDDEGKNVAESLATHIIEFAYGDLPRERHSTDVFGGSEVKKTMSHEAYDKEVRGGAANVIRKIGFEKCVKVLELFQFGEAA